MHKFKEGDKVRFKDVPRARRDYERYFKTHFLFDDVVTIGKGIADSYVEIAESWGYVTDPDYLEFATGQMKLPFKWGWQI